MKLSDLVKLKPIIEAIEQGKSIQYGSTIRDLDGYEVGKKWSDIKEIDASYIPLLAANSIEYRIKPEPREFSIAVERDGCIYRVVDVCLAKDRMVTSPTAEIIKVREVIE